MAKLPISRMLVTTALAAAGSLGAAAVPNSFAPVDDKETFEAVKAQLEKEDLLALMQVL